MSDPTISQVQKASASLATQITELVQQFETSTGCIVHSLPIFPATKTTPINVHVKVQIG